MVIDSEVQSELEPMIKGLLNKKTLLDVIRHFIVFEKTKEKTVKKIAAFVFVTEKIITDSNIEQNKTFWCC